MERLKREGTFENHLQQNRVQCHSHRFRIKGIKSENPLVPKESNETIEFKPPFAPEETEVKTPIIPEDWSEIEVKTPHPF